MKKKVMFKNIQNRLLLIYCALVCGIAFILSAAFWQKSSVAIRNNAVSLVSADMTQLQMNINSYLDKVEGTAALLFSDENYYTYDKTSDKYDEYTKLQYEDAIKTKIIDLGIMENFADFGIVYSDNTAVGWLSSTTKSMFKEEGLYNVVTKNISDERKQNGWFYSINENLDRIYYVKRLNNNAVLVASLYCRELASAFHISDELSGIAIRLIDKDNVIIYSSDTEEAGQILDQSIINTIGDSKELSYATNSNDIINVRSCTNGWRVVTMVPNSVITDDIREIKNFAFSFAIILAAIFVIAGVSAFYKISNPVDSMVASLEEKASLDGLTNILNKKAFEAKVTEELEHTVASCSLAYIIMDVDHFKSINDSLGHAYGDKFIVRTAQLLKTFLPETVILGRIGGDEFSFMIKEADKSLDEMKEYITEIITNLSKEFLKEFNEEHEKYNVSLSLGINIISYKGESFKELYKTADSALYHSKENGRNQFTFYQEDKA